jgi:prepilin-type N-terminal cleavage/methylation domain-containing protein
MKLIRKNEKGFTLIEILIALAIFGLIAAAVSGTIVQVIQSKRSTDHMTALRQVQSAGYWISQDGVQAQQVIISTAPGLPFTLTWADWDSNALHEVEYSLQDMSSGDLDYLQRKEVVNGQAADPIITIVGQYIDPNNTSCEPVDQELSAGETFTFTVTATMNQHTETRTYQIKPRALL